MTPDLQMLVWSAALFIVQMLVASAGAQGQLGLPALAGNREDLPAIRGWAGRARRAHSNMLENLLVFAIVVIVAHVAGKANPTTALGAALFFWARLAYAVIYVAGIPWLRTAAWAVSLAGIVLIFTQLF
ncbi:MAG TPA: MAPEG family protein [Allosphingosinicella sp.]|nr:MAPEG family protein [Allosphingosinicella sp.]